MHRIEALPVESLRTDAFMALLRGAAGQDDDELQRLVEEVLPTMATIGIHEGPDPVAFATYHPGEEAAVLEYLAVHASLRGLGMATALVRFIRASHPSRPLLAETDDDAVGFYRRLGFTIETALPDPRWPGSPRYRCTLT